MLGICLGAQLLASALGASVTRGPAAEVGLGEVEITDAGRADAVFAPCAPTLPVVHWHEDTYELPAGAVQLARGSRYAQQAFRAGRRAYGLQFHIEVDRELARAWALGAAEGVDLDEPGRARVERSGRQLLGRFFAAAPQ